MDGDSGYGQAGSADGVETDADAGAVVTDLADHAGFGYHFDGGEVRGRGRGVDGGDDEVLLLRFHPLGSVVSAGRGETHWKS